MNGHRAALSLGELHSPLGPPLCPTPSVEMPGSHTHLPRPHMALSTLTSSPSPHPGKPRREQNPSSEQRRPPFTSPPSPPLPPCGQQDRTPGLLSFRKVIALLAYGLPSCPLQIPKCHRCVP